ncbi:MAG TPA: lactonase family protein [Phycisphaerae bacterium]|jgi:6-phosphogluconolactonase
MMSLKMVRHLAIGLAVGGLMILQGGSVLGQVPGGAAQAKQYWVYVGNNGTTGIGLYKLDVEKGTLSADGMAAPANKPGFLAIAPNQKLLFAGVAGTGPANTAGAIESFSIDAATGKLTVINQQSSAGDEPAYVAVDPAGKNVLTANYGTATVAVLPFDTSGKLSPATTVITETGSSTDPSRQTHAYAHSINCDPSGKFAISCDLGADKLFLYKFDSTAGKLTANDPAFVTVPAGSGPRHLTFSPNGKFVYVLNEMGATVVAYSYDAAKGGLKQIQIIKTLKSDEKGNTSAEVQIDPSGKFLYASNRLTTNYLTIFAIDQATGMLTQKGYQDAMGKTPRSYRIDPTGHFMVLANQDSDNLVLFKIDQATGMLTAVGQPIASNVKAPICVKFVAASGG